MHAHVHITAILVFDYTEPPVEIAESAAAVYDVSVYDVSVYDVSVYDVSVYDVSVYDVSAYDVSVYDVSVYDVSVYGVSVYDASVYDVSVYGVSVYGVACLVCTSTLTAACCCYVVFGTECWETIRSSTCLPTTSFG